MSLPPFVWNLVYFDCKSVWPRPNVRPVYTLHITVYQAAGVCMWWQHQSGNDILTAPQPPAARCPLSYDAHLTARPGPGVLYFHTLAILSSLFSWGLLLLPGRHVVSCFMLLNLSGGNKLKVPISPSNIIFPRRIAGVFIMWRHEASEQRQSRLSDQVVQKAEVERK